MEDSHAPSKDEPTLQAVLDALDDPDCRFILRETIEPMTASDLIDACGIPKSTLYRKLELLSSASLVREQKKINPEGGQVTRYQCAFENMTVSIDEHGEFSMQIKRSSQAAEDRLADIWAMVGDEL